MSLSHCVGDTFGLGCRDFFLFLDWSNCHNTLHFEKIFFDWIIHMIQWCLACCCRWRWWWFILLIYFAFNSTEIDTHVLFKVYGINLLIHIYFISWWLWENFAFFSFQILYTIFSVMFLADDDDDDNVWYLKVQTKYSQTFIHLLMIQNRFQTLIPERRVRAVALQLNFSQ